MLRPANDLGAIDPFPKGPRPAHMLGASLSIVIERSRAAVSS